MSKYQEALNNIRFYCGHANCDEYLNPKVFEELNIIQELVDKTTPLVDKTTPMKPIIRGLSGAIHTYVHTCPVCGKELIVTNNETVIYKTKTNYCDECGQKLDWSVEND